jgi:hypothetical protein
VLRACDVLARLVLTGILVMIFVLLLLGAMLGGTGRRW